MVASCAEPVTLWFGILDTKKWSYIIDIPAFFDWAFLFSVHPARIIKLSLNIRMCQQEIFFWNSSFSNRISNSSRKEFHGSGTFTPNFSSHCSLVKLSRFRISPVSSSGNFEISAIGKFPACIYLEIYESSHLCSMRSQPHPLHDVCQSNGSFCISPQRFLR